MSEAVFIQQGNAIDHTPSADLAAGEVVVQGELVGVARTAIPANAPGALDVTGVFEFAKEAGGGVTFSTGDNAWWDNTNKVAVATDAVGVNKLLGKAVADAADADATVRIRMSQ